MTASKLSLTQHLLHDSCSRLVCWILSLRWNGFKRKTYLQIVVVQLPYPFSYDLHLRYCTGVFVCRFAVSWSYSCLSFSPHAWCSLLVSHRVLCALTRLVARFVALVWYMLRDNTMNRYVQTPVIDVVDLYIMFWDVVVIVFHEFCT